MTSTSILVVDDDPSVRQMLATALSGSGFTVYLAANGPEALIQFMRHRDAIDIVLLDVQMSGMDGPQTLLALRKIDPTVRCCFMSGYCENYGEADLLAAGAARMFPKPFGSLRMLADELQTIASGGHDAQSAPACQEAAVQDAMSQ